MQSFRESILVPKANSPEIMVCRLPEELILVIKSILNSEGCKAAQAEVS